MTTPVTIRASSFGSLFDCPARWTAIHLEGMRTPSSGIAALGKGIHRGTAVFDSEKLAGGVPSLTAATDAAVQEIEKPSEDTEWGEDSIDKAKMVAVSLTSKYCTEFAPTVEYAAVEASVESLEITDLNIILTGSTDRVRKTPDGLGIADIKTGKTAVGTNGIARTHGHGAQIGVYELVAEAALGVRMDLAGQIIGLQTNLKPETQRIGTGEIVGAREVLVGNAEQGGILAVAAELVHGRMPLWGNPKSMMCHKKYCPRFQTCFWRR